MIIGVDSSHVAGNGQINWTKAKAEGSIGFSFLRAAFGDIEDLDFSREWPRMRDLGIPRGAYFFLRFPSAGHTPAAPEAQAREACNIIGRLSKDDFPPALDVEFPGGRSETGLTAQQCLDNVMAAWHVLADKYGTAPIVYTSARVWHECLEDLDQLELATSPLWLARYPFKSGAPIRDANVFLGGRLDPPVPTPWRDQGNWWLHQYQGDAVGFPGFGGKVDMNRFHSMSVGNKGARVSWVQRKLMLEVTGIYDLGLEAEVRAFQRRNELQPDGIIGPRTFARLCW